MAMVSSRCMAFLRNDLKSTRDGSAGRGRWRRPETKRAGPLCSLLIFGASAGDAGVRRPLVERPPDLDAVAPEQVAVVEGELEPPAHRHGDRLQRHPGLELRGGELL